MAMEDRNGQAMIRFRSTGFMPRTQEAALRAWRCRFHVLYGWVDSKSYADGYMGAQAGEGG